MGDRTGIEWTDATWNPTTGCTEVSPGCDHCYAKGVAERFRGPAFPEGFDVTLRLNRLEQPLRWRRPRRIFVNSMSDLFHDKIPDEYVALVFAVMAVTPRHTYQVLTKRHGRMRALLRSPAFREGVARHAGRLMEDGDRWTDYVMLEGKAWPLPNVWLGVSVESQQWADIRIPALLDTPAAVRFISAEPLLGPVDLTRWLNGGFGTVAPADLDWVIVGGESGPGARPMDPAWARQLRDDCVAAGVAYHFKQWGQHDADGQRLPSKHAAGRELDGRTWDEYPAP